MSSTFILSHGSILEWKPMPGMTPEEMSRPMLFYKVLEQFNDLEYLPSLAKIERHDETLNMEASYEIRSRAGLALKTAPSISLKELGADMYNFNVVERMLDAVATARIVCTRGPQCNVSGKVILELSFRNSGDSQKHWYVDSMDRITAGELAEVAKRMGQAYLIDVSEIFEETTTVEPEKASALPWPDYDDHDPMKDVYFT